MKSTVILIAATVALLLAVGIVCGDEKVKVDADATSFEWLPGIWVMDRPDWMTVETWGKDTNWVYNGVGVTIRTGGKVSMEKMWIQQTKDGGMEFVADVPHNKEKVSFKLISGGDSSMKFVFENPAHDFPQRVVYQLKADGDSLYARVEGMMNGKLEGEDFAYKRRR